MCGRCFLSSCWVRRFSGVTFLERAGLLRAVLLPAAAAATTTAALSGSILLLLVVRCLQCLRLGCWPPRMRLLCCADMLQMPAVCSRDILLTTELRAAFNCLLLLLVARDLTVWVEPLPLL